MAPAGHREGAINRLIAWLVTFSPDRTGPEENSNWMQPTAISNKTACFNLN